jgi:multiple sugar transport system ATP-binding protein
MNFVDATVTGANERGLTLTLNGFDGGQAALVIPATEGAAGFGAGVTVGVRPEHVEVVDASAPDAIRLPVAQVEQLGGHGFIHCTLPDKGTMVVHFDGQSPTRAGDTVALRIPPAACHLFGRAEGEPALERRAA